MNDQLPFTAVDVDFTSRHRNLPLGHLQLSRLYPLGNTSEIHVDDCCQLLLEQHRQSPTHGHPSQIAVPSPRIPGSVGHWDLDELNPLVVIEFAAELSIDPCQSLSVQRHREPEAFLIRTQLHQLGCEYTGLPQPGWLQLGEVASNLVTQSASRFARQTRVTASS